MQASKKASGNLWYLKVLVAFFFVVLYCLSTEAFYRMLWLHDSAKIDRIECINVYAVGKTLLGTETLIVAAAKHVPDEKITVVTDDPIRRKVEVEEFFGRKRNLVYSDLNSVKSGASQHACMWLYSPESVCETSALGPGITYMGKLGILSYLPVAQNLDINTKTIAICLRSIRLR